ncbi:hypothetical protein VOLCADRAFT_90289 [Volvox carteri f. nagariensis]|uniref:Uncharacterized protein n=1 Tax=Volvox carteri f. nagariensis TaxID=3068 RepID=D8TTZ4_VOLCA|nr:uncharacterized protein VOLCADRAFT_90289 [Volvox carteri f. nagariensis]EFJ48951.1 hypothetical protein VOLCADRAFT_90289 [Volvox carteri f. nagariensis]|eukprot:XP_002949848.1 hypothetical protein VOLCADRAFT_90289 [Volvox carteri f. nagariensis]
MLLAVLLAVSGTVGDAGGVGDRSARSGNGGEGEGDSGDAAVVSGLRVLPLSAVDFVLLVLLAVVLCYVLPSKVLRQLRSPRCGGAAAAAAAGDLWRQQQQLAALAAALQELPGGDALPLVVLRGAQQALACVEHTLHGMPAGGGSGGSGAAAAAADSSSLLRPRNDDVLGDDGRGGRADSGMYTTSETVVATDARTAGDGEVRDSKMEVSERPSGGVQAGERDPRGRCRELLAVDKVVGILQGVLAAVTSAASGGRSDGGDSSGDWDLSSYTVALLHSYLALSSDLLGTEDIVGVPGVEGESTACAAAAGAGGMSRWGFLWRDELASAARLTLPAGVYASIVVAMGWEMQLIELLGWLPDSGVATAALARVVGLCPALAPGLVATLLDSVRSGNGSSPDAAGRAICMMAAQQEPAGGSVFCSSTWANRLVYSPGFVFRIAKAVRQAATTACGGAGKGDGRRWLPCLLLLGRVLVDALHRHVAAEAGGIGAAAMVATAPEGECGGADASWAETCCEALQEGLCAWQEAVLRRTDAVDATVARIESTASTATRLLWLLQDELKDLLDMKPGAAGGGRGPTGSEGQRRLLSCGAVIRLRTRITLISMQAAAGAAAAAAAPQPPQPGCKDQASIAVVGNVVDDEADGVVDTAAADHTTPDRRSDPVIRKAAALTAGDVWLGLDLPYGFTAAGLTDEFGGSANTEDAVGGRFGGVRSPLPQHLAVGSEKASPWPSAGHKRQLPEWLKAATASTAAPTRLRCAGSTGGSQLLANAAAAAICFRLASSPPPSLRLQPPDTAKGFPERNAEAAMATGRVAAIAVALLTPGVGSWLYAHHDPRVVSAGDPNPYSPFRVALALLELLQGRLGSGYWKDLGMRSGPEDAGARASTAAAASDRDMEAAAGVEQDLLPGWGRSGFVAVPEEGGQQRQLELRLMRMAAECLACVGGPGQQAALQAVVLGSPMFRRCGCRPFLSKSLSSCPVLSCIKNDLKKAAAGRALVALSNRAAAMESSLERRALSAQQEAQRLATAATNLLPYAVLVPEEVVLLDAQRWMRTSADRRSLVTLLGGLMETGLVLPRQLLQDLVGRGLAPRGENGDGRSRSIAQIHCAMLVAQFVLGVVGTGGGVSDVPRAGSFYNPAVELAAARPARLLLAVADALQELYDAYAERHQLEAVAIDAAAAVLERAVQLYGDYLCAGASRGDGSGVAGRVLADLGTGDACELRELAAGCASLPRAPHAKATALYGVLRAPSAARTLRGWNCTCDARFSMRTASQNSIPLRTFAQLTIMSSREGLFHSVPLMNGYGAERVSVGLRSASTDFARAAIYDVLCFVASSNSNAVAVQQALLHIAAVDDDAEEVEDEGAKATGDNGKSSAAYWFGWFEAPSYDDGTTRAAAAATAKMSQHGRDAEGVVGRHVAATAARGLPQLPAARFLEGGIAALGALLPTAAPEQARRLLLGLLPVLVRAVGGAAVLHAAVPYTSSKHCRGGGATTALGTSGITQDGAQAASLEVIETWLLGAPAGHGSGSPAADVAISIVMACRGAVAALCSMPIADASASPKGAGGCLQAEEAAQQPAAAEPPLPSPPSRLLLATADRCAAYIALLASRLASTAAAVSADGATVLLPRPPQLPTAPASGASAAQPPKHGTTSLEIAVVAVVLLSELCGIVAVVAELADDRALVTWQFRG